MNVSFLTPSISRALGGIYEIERSLAQSIDRQGLASVSVIGLEDAYASQDLSSWRPLMPTVLPVSGPSAFGYSARLLPALLASDADLVHLHSLWMYPSIAVQRWRKRTGRPHVVTIHGMLDPWALNNGRWKKHVAGWLYEKSNLQGAACLQVNSESELQFVRAYGIDTPVCVIPNGVNLPEGDASDIPPWEAQIPAGQKVMLFLGRIHPKKGISELLKAWEVLEQGGDANSAEWTLAIVGWDDGGHAQALRHQVVAAGLERAHLLGPMFGADKAAAFQHADAFILPSYSEGLPMAVLEAWSYELPVLMTPECNLPVGFASDAAKPISTAPEALAHDLLTFLHFEEGKHKYMGQNGRSLVEQRFTWPHIAQQMASVYQWILGEDEMPSTVRIT